MVANLLRPGIVDKVLLSLVLMISDSCGNFRLTVLQDASEDTIGDLAQFSYPSLSQFNYGYVVVVLSSNSEVFCGKLALFGTIAHLIIIN